MILTLGFVAGCVQSSETVASSQTPGRAYYTQQGVVVSLTPGVVVFDGQARPTTTMRASVPNPQLDLSTTQDAQDSFTLTLTNIAKGATVRVISNGEQSRSSILGGIDQTSANACIKDEPRIESCLNAQTIEERCAPPALDFTTPTQATLTLELEPCRRVLLSIEPPPSLQETLTFGLVGQTEDTTQLRSSLELMQAQDIDMVIVLAGSRTQSDDYIRALIASTSGLSVPVVMLKGDIEDDQSTQFAEFFGPTDFRWTLGDVQFVSFFGDSNGVGPRGLDLLEALLIAAAKEEQRNRPSDESSRQWPLFSVSSASPLPSGGLVEDGYSSRLEAGRVLSLLALFGVDTLFASGAHAVEQQARPLVTTTQVASPGFAEGQKLLIVEVTSTPQQGSRALGVRHVLTRTLDGPSTAPN